jgi:hypothetical protein
MSISRIFNLFSSCVLTCLLLSCDQTESPPNKPKANEKSQQKKADKLKARISEGSQKVERFTGAHTRIVWAEHQSPSESDAFARSTNLVLKGYDTRDGKGERRILPTVANYTKPLLSSTGEVILFTEKNLMKSKKVKQYSAFIYRTDWSSTSPVKVLEGYALDCWRDPATGLEWVYAAQDLRPGSNVSLEARKLVRFPLDEPSKIEVVYDDGLISLDNIQLSRSGKRASGLFPWPQAGIFVVQEGQWSAKKLLTGCWPSMAPDDSGVSWIFDGDHRSATFFSHDGARKWDVKMNEGPRMQGHEIYHPRWSNHARFMVLTGPYTKEKNTEGSVIAKGGATAQVYLAKLSEDATRIEDWLQITGDALSESYPDVWIEGGETANLKLAETPGGFVSGDRDKWPATKNGLLLLWKDRNALNSFRTRQGTKLTTVLQFHGAARYGRWNEVLLGGGFVTLESESAAEAIHHFKEKPDWTLEAVLIPQASPANGLLVQAPGLKAEFVAGKLKVTQADGLSWQTEAALPAESYHLAITHAVSGFNVFAQGKSLPLKPLEKSDALPMAESISLGGGWEGGLMHFTMHDAELGEEAIAMHHVLAQERLQQLPAPSPGVKLRARLAEVSAMPTPEGIDPYTSALVVYVYEVEQVLEGSYNEKEILVKHWAMLDQKPVLGLPRNVGESYELTVENASEHEHLKGERVMDDTRAFDLQPWFDVTTPRVKE